MSASVTSSPNTLFKVGWIILVSATALMVLNHLFLAFGLGNVTVGIGFAAFNLYALIVLLIPFRRMERWAWYATWIMPVGLAGPAYTAPEVAFIYYIVAAVLVVGLLLTAPAFFAANHSSANNLVQHS